MPPPGGDNEDDPSMLCLRALTVRCCHQHGHRHDASVLRLLSMCMVWSQADHREGRHWCPGHECHLCGAYPLAEREGMFRNLQRLMPGGGVLAIQHHREFFLESIVVEGSGITCGTVHFACNFWVQTTRELPGNSKRVFFGNKVVQDT